MGQNPSIAKTTNNRVADNSLHGRGVPALRQSSYYAQGPKYNGGQTEGIDERKHGKICP
jgi:hypothetical protein